MGRDHIALRSVKKADIFFSTGRGRRFLVQARKCDLSTVPVRLLVQTLGGVERAVRSGVASIGVGSQLHMDMTGFRRIDIAGVQVVPVAAPTHPLARASKAAPPQARDFVQLVLSEQPSGASRDFGVVSLNTWRISDQAARHKLLLAGLGWCGMPEPIVRADIETGRLVRLNLPDWRGGEYTLQAIHKTDTPPGRAGRWLIERLVTLSDGVEAPAQKITKPSKGKGRRPSQKALPRANQGGEASARRGR